MAFAGRLQQSANGDVCPFKPQLPNVGERKVANVVDELGEHVHPAHDGLNVSRAGFVHPVAQRLHGAADHSQRSSQLMRDVREELAA